MKITKYLLPVVAVFAFACSDDDEPGLDKKALSFGADAAIITAPAAMQTSEDPQAQMAVSWIAQANAMTSFLAYAQAPSGANKSSERITASNGRVKAAGDYVVYTWHDEQSGYTIGYQISEASDSYAFEIFLKLPGKAEWLKYIHAEEKKDRSEGFMKVYSIYGDDPSVVWFAYEWSRSGDVLTLTVSDPAENFNIKLVINEKTRAGSVTNTFDGVKQYEMTWDAAGNGTWTYYDEEGVLVDEGSWTA